MSQPAPPTPRCTTTRSSDTPAKPTSGLFGMQKDDKQGPDQEWWCRCLQLFRSDGAFGRFDLAALCGCRTLNFCLFVKFFWFVCFVRSSLSFKLQGSLNPKFGTTLPPGHHGGQQKACYYLAPTYNMQTPLESSTWVGSLCWDKIHHLASIELPFTKQTNITPPSHSMTPTGTAGNILLFNALC